MTKQLNENTSFKLSIKTLAAIAALIFTLVGMWFTLQADIEEARKLPAPEVSEIEFSLKDEMIRNEILNQSKQLEQILQRIERIENKIYE